MADEAVSTSKKGGSVFKSPVFWIIAIVIIAGIVTFILWQQKMADNAAAQAQTPALNTPINNPTGQVAGGASMSGNMATNYAQGFSGQSNGQVYYPPSSYSPSTGNYVVPVNSNLAPAATTPVPPPPVAQPPVLSSVTAANNPVVVAPSNTTLIPAGGGQGFVLNQPTGNQKLFGNGLPQARGNLANNNQSASYISLSSSH